MSLTEKKKKKKKNSIDLCPGACTGINQSGRRGQTVLDTPVSPATNQLVTVP
jgi:hypothetical protein